MKRLRIRLLATLVGAAAALPAQEPHVGRIGVGPDTVELDMIRSAAAAESAATVELYRASTPCGPWYYATNGILDAGTASHTLTMAREPDAPQAFFATLLFDDSDGDGLSDCYERLVTRSDPANPDSDGDGLSDGYEITVGSDPNWTDTDGDGLDDPTELALGTLPYERDTDGDGLSDGEEVNDYGTNPCDALEDTDGDGLRDAWEIRYGFDRYTMDDVGLDDDEDGLDNRSESDFDTDPYNADTDGDGWNDAWEAKYLHRPGIDPLVPYGGELADSDDNDDLDLDLEAQYGTDPFDPDTDGDGLPDGWEVREGLDPCDAEGDNGPYGDPDGDGLTNLQEYELKTYACYGDTDFDGLSDGDEVNVHHTDPHDADSDGDGLSDGDEISLWGTDPLDADSDHDGLSDGEEINTWFTNPADPDSDADGDGLPDGWETKYGLNPRLAADDEDDLDHDGLTDKVEFEIGTDPSQPDTDGDGLDDAWEYQYQYGGRFDPCSNAYQDLDELNDPYADLDGDGVDNRTECILRLNPYKTDTDGDGVSDGDEILQHSNPRDATDEGTPYSRKVVSFTFGDPSSSHSEKYLLHVHPQAWSNASDSAESYDILNAAYGEVETVNLFLRAGVTYVVSLDHASTNLGEDVYPSPDPDYELGLSIEAPWQAVVYDPGALLGNYETDEPVFIGEGLEATFTIFVPTYDIGFTPDWNRDGRFNDEDALVQARGFPFRFWVNDDNDAADDGDCIDGTTNVDRPAGDGDATADLVVNGRRDRVDFTPMFLNLGEIRNIYDPTKVRVRMRQLNGAINVIWSDLACNNANAFQTSDDGSFGADLDKPLDEAQAVQFKRDWIIVPQAFVDLCLGDSLKGVFLVEGRATANRPLEVEVWYETERIASAEIPLSISKVEEMYRWMNLREAASGSPYGPDLKDWTEAPANRPDAETDGRHFVFVHGFNVNYEQARGWSAEIFKRLWQAGLESSFVTVDWYGDESQLETLFHGGVSPDYYANVAHAFGAAETMARELNTLDGAKILLGHSLGNMVVSSACADHALSYAKYYLLNAAVAQEAYNAQAYDDLMVDGAWKDFPLAFRAALYASHFTADDFRSTLSWKGRFGALANAVNVYSPTEDVLTNPSEIKIFDMKLAENNGGAWAKQELFKGCFLWNGINLVTSGTTAIQGGWGINAKYTANPLAYTPGIGGLHTSYFADWQDGDYKTNVVFTSFRDTRLAQREMAANISDRTELRAKLLGNAIPAESFAAGANPVLTLADLDYRQTLTPDARENWPRGSSEHGLLWYHSDLKNVAYYYVHGFYKKLITDNPK